MQKIDESVEDGYRDLVQYYINGRTVFNFDEDDCYSLNALDMLDELIKRDIYIAETSKYVYDLLMFYDDAYIKCEIGLKVADRVFNADSDEIRAYKAEYEMIKIEILTRKLPFSNPTQFLERMFEDKNLSFNTFQGDPNKKGKSPSTDRTYIH